jgi:hypothetical protein
MVRVSFQIIKSEEQVSRLPFAGLCNVMHAGLVVLETRGIVNEEVIDPTEIEPYMIRLQWFARRWRLGEEYLARAEKLLGWS